MKKNVAKGQTDMFEAEREARLKEMFIERYRLWEEMPDIIVLKDGTDERAAMYETWCWGSPRWHIQGEILHECAEMPPEMKCWLNTAQPPEFWVIYCRETHESKRVKICPYCGSQIAEGHGDVVVYKDDEPIGYRMRKEAGET